MALTSRTILWSVFGVLLIAGAIIALRACVLSLPGLGVIISRCPEMAIPQVSLPDAEANELLREYDELRRQIAHAPACPVAPANFDIAQDIQRGGNVVFILDTSSSMKPDYSGPAKNILKTAFEKPPPGVDMSLWGFGAGCQAKPNLLTAGDDSNAISVINSIDFETGTYLAPAILNIPEMLPPGVGVTPDKPANVVLIADGSDPCNSDDAPALLKGHPLLQSASSVCVAAEVISNRLPHVAIHVVALTDGAENALNCVRHATNGGIIKSADPTELQNVVGFILGAGAKP